MSRLKLQRFAAAFAACAALAALAPNSRAQNLQLTVNPYSGAMTIHNTSAVDAAGLDGYQITSAAGRLVPDPSNTAGVGWDSLTDSGQAGWAEFAPSANALSELSLSTAYSIAPGGSRSIGKAFNPLGARDVAWGYSVHAPGTQTVTQPGAIQYAGGLQFHVVDLVGPGNVVEGTRVVLYNPESVAINVDAYTVSSVNGSLNPAGFNGMAGHNVPGWASFAPTANALSELNLSGSTTFGPGQVRALGSPFTTGATDDLQLVFHLVGQGGNVENGTVAHFQRLTGDANFDGVVDIFDVNVVSDNWGTSNLNGDTNLDGIVDIFDVNVISDNWGDALGGVAAVPEPSSLALGLLGIVGAYTTCRRRASNMLRVCPPCERK